MAGSLLSNTAYNALAKLSSALASLLVGAFAARRLGVTAFGEGQYLVWFSSVIWIYLNAGLPTAITRYVAVGGSGGNGGAGDLKRLVVKITAAIVLIGIIAIEVFVDAGPLLRIEAMLLFALTSVQALLLSYCEGRQAFGAVFRATAAGSAAMLTAFYPLISMFGLAGFLATYILGSAFFIAVIVASREMAGQHAEGTIAGGRKEIAQYALYAWIGAVISTFMWQRGELFFIKHYLSAADVAYFSVSMSLAAIVTQPLSLLSSALFPYFAQTVAAEPERAKAMYALLTKLFAWSTFFFCFFAAAHSQVILTTVYGRDFREAGGLTAVILAGSSFGVIGTVGSSLVYGAGRSRAVAIMGVLGVAIAFFSGMVIIPAYGVISAGITKVLNQGVMVVCGTVYIARFLGYPFPWKSYGVSLAAAGMVVIAGKYLLPGGSLLSVMLNLVATGALYALVTWGGRIFSRNDLDVLRSAGSRFSSALRLRAG